MDKNKLIAALNAALEAKGSRRPIPKPPGVPPGYRGATPLTLCDRRSSARRTERPHVVLRRVANRSAYDMAVDANKSDVLRGHGTATCCDPYKTSSSELRKRTPTMRG